MCQVEQSGVDSGQQDGPGDSGPIWVQSYRGRGCGSLDPKKRWGGVPPPAAEIGARRPRWRCRCERAGAGGAVRRGAIDTGKAGRAYEREDPVRGRPTSASYRCGPVAAARGGDTRVTLERHIISYRANPDHVRRGHPGDCPLARPLPGLRHGRRPGHLVRRPMLSQGAREEHGRGIQTEAPAHWRFSVLRSCCSRYGREAKFAAASRRTRHGRSGGRSWGPTSY